MTIEDLCIGVLAGVFALAVYFITICMLGLE